MAMRIAKSAPAYFPKRKPAKSKAYLAWIHELPCVVTGRHGVEAAHLSFAATEYAHYGRAKGRKAPDRWALPLCSQEHHKQHDMGDERAYWQHTGINPHILALVIYGLWSEMGEDATEAATAVIMQGVTAR